MSDGVNGAPNNSVKLPGRGGGELADGDAATGVDAGGGAAGGGGCGRGADGGGAGVDKGCGAAPNSAVKLPAGGLEAGGAAGGVIGGAAGGAARGPIGGAAGGDATGGGTELSRGGNTGFGAGGVTIAGETGAPNSRVNSLPASVAAGLTGGGVFCGSGPPVRITTVVCVATAASSQSRKFTKSGRNSVTITGTSSTSTRASTVVARVGSESIK